MAVQIPMIQIPWKRCEEADWVASLRRYISGVLEQNPDEFLEPIYELHRLRQDTRGVNMDVTGRDLLYRYFSQLELLDLRFQLEKKPLDLSFTWTDVFGQSAVTQSSLAFEKACVIFNMGSILSNLGTYQDRSEPEGLRKANHFFMFAASMLQFIGENFIHAPSEDLSANTLRVLQQLMLAQAQECFLERCLQEMKKDTLIAKIANQNAWMYTNVVENMSECFKNRAFEEQWLTVCQIKQRYYQAAAQYHKGLACEADGRYGEAVARLTLAESQGAEAFKMAKPFVHIFDPNSPYPLLPDTATCLHDLVLTLRELVKEKLAMLTRDNDMIYHEVVPKTSILPPIDKICMVKTHPLHEMYTSPGELQRVVGRDLFIQVVPMQVHESASVYDEEKAKLIRQVMDKVDAADSELDSAFAFMQLPSSLTKFRSGESNLDASLQELADPPPQVHEWAHHIAREENSANVLQELVTTVESLRARIRQQLDASGMALDEEQRECERLRVEYGDDWTQVPSGALAAQFRKEIRSRRDALDQAYVADSDTLARYQQVQPQLMVLRSGPRGDALVGAFAEMVETSVRKWRAEHHDEASTLLDVEDEETTNILQYADQIDETANQLTQLKRDRQLVLQELKDTSRQDDISHILLLNRRNKDLEPQIFTNELNKYTPIVEKVDHTVDQQRELIQSLSEAFKLLMDHPEAARIQQAWDTVEMQRDKLLQQLQDAYENYGEVKANAQQGVTFYTNLANLVTELSAKVQSFGRQRREERERLLSRLEQSRSALDHQALRDEIGKLPPRQPMQASPVARARGGSTGAPPTLEAVHQLTRQTANLGLTPHPRGGYDGSDRYELVTQEPVRRPLGGNDAAIQPSLAGQRPGARPDPNQARLAAAARPHVAFSPDMTQAQVQTTTAESATGPPERDMRDSEMAAANQFNPPKSMHAGIASATDASVSTIPRIPSCPEPSSNANSRTAGPNDTSYPYPHLGPGLAVSGPEPTAAAPAPSIEELLHKASSTSMATASPHAPTGQEPVPDGLSKLFNQSAQDNVPEVFHPQRQPPPKHLGKLPGPFAKMDAGSTPFYPHPPAVPVASTHHPQQALASDPNPPAPVPQYTSLPGSNPPGHQHESVPPVPEAMYPSDGRTSAPGGANSAAQNLSGLGSPAQYFASQLQAMVPSQQSAESARAAAQQAPSYPSQPDQAPPGYPFPPMQPSAPLVEANRSPPPAVPHPGTTASPLHRNYSPQSNLLYGAGQVPGSSGTPTRDSTAPTYGYPGSGPAHSLGYNAPSQSRPGVTHLPQSPPPMQSTQSPAQYYHGMASTTSGTTTTAMSAFSPAYSSASPASTTMAHSPTLVYSQPYRPTYAPQPHSQGPSYSVPLPGPSPGTSTQATHYLSQATTQHAQSPYQPITSLSPTQPAVTSAPAYPAAGSYPAPPNHPMASPGHLPPTSMGNVLGQYQSPQPVAQGYTAAAMGANYTAGNLTSPSMPPPQHPPSHPEGGGLQGSWRPGASKPAQTSYSSTSSQVSMEGGYNPGSNQAPYPPPGQTGPSGHHRPIVGHADGPVPGSVPNHAAIPGAYHGQPPHVTAGTSSYAPTPAASNYPAASTSVPADSAPPPGPYPRHPPAGSGPPLGHPSAQATQPYPHTMPGSSTVANQIYAPNHGQSATMQYGGGNQFTVPHPGNVSAASNSTAYGLSPNVTAMQPPQGHYAPPPAGHYNPAAPHAPSSHHPAATGHPAPQQIPGGSGLPPSAPYTAPGSHPVGFTAPPPHTYQSSTQTYPPGPQHVPQAHQQLPPGHNSAGQMPYTAPPHYHPPPLHQHYTHSQASSHAQPPPAQPMATYQTPAPQQPYTHTPAYPGHDGHASSAGSSLQTAAGYPYPPMDPIGHHPSASGPTSGTQPPGPANPQAYYHQPVYQAPTPGTNQHSYSNPPPENPYQSHPSGQGGHSSARNLMD